MEITESTKKHYRALGEMARRCDVSKQDLLLRQQIRDYAEKALFGAPLEFGRKAEDALWRKAFYEPLAYFKSKREKSSWTLASIEQLLTSGLGAYHRILIRLEGDFGVPLSGIVDASLRQRNDESFGRRLDEFPSEKQAEITDWALQCAHRCLIAQGDLERYLHELSGQQDSCAHRLASLRFYQQAIMLRPQIGQPFNQMGTLEGPSLYGLRSLYYYLRCLLSPDPFVGATSNLKTTFEKNRVSLQKVRNTAQSSEKGHEELHVRSFIVIVESLWREEVPDRSTIITIIEALKVENFQQGVLFYCVLVSLCVDERMRTLHQGDVHKNSKTVSDLLNVLGNRMIVEVFHNLCMKTCVDHPYSNESIPTKNGNIIAASTDAEIAVKRPKHKYRRRRKAFGDSSDDDNDTDQIVKYEHPNGKHLTHRSVSRRRARNGSDCSDGEDNEVTPSESSEESDDLNSENELSSDDDIASELEELDEGSAKGTSSATQLSKEFSLNTSLSCKQLVKQVISEKLLGAIKLFFDWILLDATGKNIDMCFVKRAADLANLLYVLQHRIMASTDRTIEHVRQLIDSLAAKELPMTTVQLPEDIQYPLLKDRVMKKPQLTTAVLLQSWETRSQVSTDGQRSVFRLHYIADCVRKLCVLLPESDISVVPGQRITIRDHIFETIKAELEKTPLPVSCQKAGRQHGLMKSMAHAWLQHEVKGLEEQLESKNHQNSSPNNSNGSPRSKNSVKQINSLYTVVDSSVLAYHLPLVRSMIASRSSIVVIPICVVNELDDMKKDVATARDANRWLSLELPKGLRYLRVQRSEEATELAVLKYPKRKDRDAWQLFQILECCQYFNGKENFGASEVNNNSNVIKDGAGSTTLVSLLYSKSESQLPSNVTSLTETLGVKLVDVDQIASVSDVKPKSRLHRYRLSKANKQTG